MNRRSLVVLALLASLPAASLFAEGSAMAQLRAQAGDDARQAPAPAATPRPILPPRPEDMPEYDDDTAPVPPGYVPRAGYPVRPMIACTMSLRYREVTDQIPFPILNLIRVGKHIDGTAVITCPDRVIPLRIHGDGFAPGVQIPNGFAHSVNGYAAGDIEIRLPSVFLPKQLEGTYTSIGGELLGVGGSFSPWVNSDSSLDFKFYLPTTLNLSIGADLSTLTLTLM